MRTFKWMRVIALILCFVAWQAAPLRAVAVESFASLSNIRITLIDLDPNDGIEPSYTVTDWRSFVRGSSGLLNTSLTRHFGDGAPGFLTPLQGEWRSGTGHAFAQIGADFMRVSATSYALTVEAFALTGSSFLMPFSLSPFTEMRVTGDSELHAKIGNGVFADALSRIVLGDLAEEGRGPDDNRHYMEIDPDILEVGGARSEFLTLSKSLMNLSSAWLPGVLEVTVRATAVCRRR